MYVVPRASGETVIGATVEDAGYDETVTDEATQLLMAQAIRIMSEHDFGQTQCSEPARDLLAKGGGFLAGHREQAQCG